MKQVAARVLLASTTPWCSGTAPLTDSRLVVTWNIWTEVNWRAFRTGIRQNTGLPLFIHPEAKWHMCVCEVTSTEPCWFMTVETERNLWQTTNICMWNGETHWANFCLIYRDIMQHRLTFLCRHTHTHTQTQYYTCEYFISFFRTLFIFFIYPFLL